VDFRFEDVNEHMNWVTAPTSAAVYGTRAWKSKLH
jgi:hypothetical protein